MKIQAVLLLLIMLLLVPGGVVSEENQSAQNNSTSANLTDETIIPEISPQEKLMNRAFEARTFALEKGKDAALAEFSNPAGQYNTEGMVIIAYGIDGVLLADITRPGEVGSRFIADDHDAGQVRMMRDLATTGGGLYIDAATGNYWFVSDIDGSWWICAAISRNTGKQA